MKKKYPLESIANPDHRYILLITANESIESNQNEIINLIELKIDTPSLLTISLRAKTGLGLFTM